MKRLFVILLGACSLGAQAQQWLPPHELVHEAIDAQPDVVAARARVDAARAHAGALAAGPHEFQLDAVAQRRSTDELGGRQRFSESEFTLSRAIRLPGKAALDRRIGDAGVVAAELRLDDARHQGARRMLDDWMDWLRAAEHLRTAEATSALLERERSGLARRVELGESSRKDLDLIDVERAQAQARLLAAQAALHSTREAMHSDFPGLPIPASALAVDPPLALPETPQAWIDRIIARSHEIGALAADAEQADARAARARAERIADPVLGFRRLDERGGAEQVNGLVLSIPLGGRYRAANAQAESAQAAAVHGDVASMRRDISREAVVTVTAAATLAAQWQAQRDALDASVAALKRVKRGWELGEVAVAEWLLVQRQHTQIAAAEADARADAERARLRVLVDAHDLWHDE
ncbi:TolC family protein [Thermomonas sp. LB-4]|uniref:TolC family protein n=1 Tax=Thermomonas sp. LB-4 TaxID=3102790 RepID=UPI002ED849A0